MSDITIKTYDTLAGTSTHKVLSGLYYHRETSDEIIGIIDRLHRERTRVVISYGDVVSGRMWGIDEETDVTGRISNSMGPVKIPILIHNSRSMGGGSLLEHGIIRIRYARGKSVIYQHPNFHPSPNGFYEWAEKVRHEFRNHPDWDTVKIQMDLPYCIEAESLFLEGYDPEAAALRLWDMDADIASKVLT